MLASLSFPRQAPRPRDGQANAAHPTASAASDPGHAEILGYRHGVFTAPSTRLRAAVFVQPRFQGRALGNCGKSWVLFHQLSDAQASPFPSSNSKFVTCDSKMLEQANSKHRLAATVPAKSPYVPLENKQRSRHQKEAHSELAPKVMLQTIKKGKSGRPAGPILSDKGAWLGSFKARTNTSFEETWVGRHGALKSFACDGSAYHIWHCGACNACLKFLTSTEFGDEVAEWCTRLCRECTRMQNMLRLT